MECDQCGSEMEEFENITCLYDQKKGEPKRPGWICPICGLKTYIP